MYDVRPSADARDLTSTLQRLDDKSDSGSSVPNSCPGRHDGAMRIDGQGRRFERRWAVGRGLSSSQIAAMLHDKYGSDLELRVGAMAFPSHGIATNPAAWQLDGRRLTRRA
jgi:hypothetical protein